MPVKIQGEHSFDAPREAVWEALMDPEVLARTLPGAEKLERVGENQLAGALDMRIGPVQGKFQGTVTMTDVRPPEGYHLSLKGTGAAGFVEGSGTIRLTDAGAGTTLHYDVEAQVGGRIAGVGQRLLDSSARVVTRQALEGLERQIAARVASHKEAAVAAGPAADIRTAAGAAGPSADRAAAGEIPAAGSSAAGPSAAGVAADAPAAAGSAGDGPLPFAPAGFKAGSGAPAPPPAPSQAKFAFDFAKGLLGELIPRERRPLAVAIVLAVAGLVTVVLFRACGG